MKHKYKVEISVKVSDTVTEKKITEILYDTENIDQTRNLLMLMHKIFYKVQYHEKRRCNEDTTGLDNDSLVKELTEVAKIPEAEVLSFVMTTDALSYFPIAPMDYQAVNAIFSVEAV